MSADFVRPMSHDPRPVFGDELGAISGVRVIPGDARISCEACGRTGPTQSEINLAIAGFLGYVRAGHVELRWVCPTGPGHAVVRFYYPGPIL